MTSGCFQLAIDERGIEDQLGLGVRDLRLWPALDLALQRLKVPLNPVNADRKRADQVEALGVLGQHRRKHAWDTVSMMGAKNAQSTSERSNLRRKQDYGEPRQE